jgi:hypothetical protein
MKIYVDSEYDGEEPGDGTQAHPFRSIARARLEFPKAGTVTLRLQGKFPTSDFIYRNPEHLEVFYDGTPWTPWPRQGEIHLREVVMNTAVGDLVKRIDLTPEASKRMSQELDRIAIGFDVKEDGSIEMLRIRWIQK